MVTKTIPALLALLATLAVASQTNAKILRVAPGPGTPLQDAIDQAAAGDTIRVAFGRYPEAIVVDKRLRIIGESSTVDAECGAPAAITVAADRVRLERLRILGGAHTQVDVQGRDSVTIRFVRSAPTCEGVQHAIDASGATRLNVVKSNFYGYRTDDEYTCPAPDARRFAVALRISDTPLGGGVRASGNFVCQADVGILVDGAPDAPRTRPPVKVERNVVYASGRGIVLRDADGTIVRANQVQSTGGDVVGIEVEAGSDDNALRSNKVQGFPTDVSDAGTSNCWRANKFTTGSVPETGCP